MVEHAAAMLARRWAAFLRAHVLKGMLLEPEELRGFGGGEKP
jgi:hypothetical protein